MIGSALTLPLFGAEYYVGNKLMHNNPPSWARPPLSVGSEDALLLFVARTAGSVGYVDGRRAADLPDGVARLFCVNAPPPTSKEADDGADRSP